MPKLLSSKEIVAVLLKNGFMFISQKGSHAKYRLVKGTTYTVIVPMAKKQIPLGTFRSIVRQSGLNKEDFTGKI